MWQIYLLCNLLSIVLQGYFSMMEMASISINKLRLEYLSRSGDKRAAMVSALLQRPTYFFAVTLMGVNFFLQVGSQYSRLLYLAWGINEDYAPIYQITMVVLFAEFIPMLFSRMHAESIALGGIYPIYMLCKLFKPIIWVLNQISIFCSCILRVPKRSDNYLSREEVRVALEYDGRHERSKLVENLFSLKKLYARDLVFPIEDFPLIDESTSVMEAKDLLKSYYKTIFLTYRGSERVICGAMHSANLLAIDDSKRLSALVSFPWFVSANLHSFELLEEFKNNDNSIGIVVDKERVLGVVTMKSLMEEIFRGTIDSADDFPLRSTHMIDKSFLSTTIVKDVNLELQINLPHEREALYCLMTRVLGSRPQMSDLVTIGKIMLSYEGDSFLKDGWIRVTSR